MQLLIRADASAQIGTGHIMRCLALAQAWQAKGGKVTFLMGMIAPELEDRLQSEGCAVVHHEESLGSQADGAFTIEQAQILKAKAVVVDGYHFGATYQQQLKAAGLKILFVDDNGHAEHYAADWVLNQNIYAHEGFYASRAPYTELLLGTQYSLLRQEFWTWRGWQRQIPPVARKVLVTLGGGDSENVTLMVMQALQQVVVSDLTVAVVVGANNPHYETLQEMAQTSSVQFEVHRNVTNMPELMAWADVAIAAGGSTCWELAFMRLPSLILVLADNQNAIAETLHSKGIVHNVGWFKDISIEALTTTIASCLKDFERRQLMQWRGQILVDGQGSRRVATVLHR